MHVRKKCWLYNELFHQLAQKVGQEKGFKKILLGWIPIKYSKGTQKKNRVKTYSESSASKHSSMVQATTAVILHAGAAKIVQSYLHAMFSLKDQNDGCGKGSTQH